MEDPAPTQVLAMSSPSRILIIDDNPSDRDLLREAIRDVGWIAELAQSANGAQALAFLGRQAMRGALPDVLLLDYRLRHERGTELIASIRAIGGCANLPIVLLSSAALPHGERSHCRALGIERVLVKAESYAALLELVRELRTDFASTQEMTPGGSWIGTTDAAVADRP